MLYKLARMFDSFKRLKPFIYIRIRATHIFTLKYVSIR